MEAFFYIELACVAVALLCVVSFLVLAVCCSGCKKEKLKIEHSEKRTSFAVIIPARNESAVIESNLSALYKSNYPKEYFHPYVIVESMDDPTVEICKKYDGVSVFLRQNLANTGKGHALDECISNIFKENDVYDAFLILDADNVVTPDFLSKMSDAFQAGYEAACGNRNNKDWNASAVSSSSALTFTIINSIQNKSKTALGLGITFTGTGFFVSAEILRRLGGWKFYSLTEDYEFSTFAMCNGVKSCFVEDAIYYDEQPRTWWQSIIQRTRWVKGYFVVRIGYRKMKKEYAKRMPKNKDIQIMRFGTMPMLVLAIDAIAYVVNSIVGAIVSAALGWGIAHLFLIRIIIVLGLVYLIIMLLTVYLFHIEKGRASITSKNKVKTVFYHPIYLASYVVAALRALFIKNRWEVVEHSINNDIEGI
ncbi:MAG: glycosyltransferase family 2 protein [Clostridia bacterium]|nr:glycosyltransferase family 2 protein [Clostridia bacterium]